MIRWMLFYSLLVSGAAWAAPAAERSPFDRADRNGDGRVTKQEFVESRTERFDQIDRNGDSKIDRADFPAATDHKRTLAFIDRQIANADRDGDGAVSRAELAGAATPLFDRADVNRDGVVGQEEAAAFRNALAARRAGAAR